MLWIIVLVLLILVLAGGFALTHFLFWALIIVLILAAIAFLSGRGGAV